MEIGFSLEQAAGAAGQLGSAVGPTFWIILILAVAGIGRMVFVAWGDRLTSLGSIGGLSGGTLMGLAGLLMVGVLYLSDREVRAWIMFKRSFVDPVIVDVLGKDSCNPARNRFCVVTWEEDGREVIVNWHDKRIKAMDVYGGYEFTLYEALRPQMRPAHLGEDAAVTALNLEGQEAQAKIAQIEK